jgi:hypothetical protein
MTEPNPPEGFDPWGNEGLAQDPYPESDPFPGEVSEESEVEDEKP